MPETHDAGRLFTHPVMLSPDSPVVHKAFTAEYDDPCRHSPTIVLRTWFRRAGRWHGIRKSWLSVQVKLPTGERIPGTVWGIVIGWWRYPKIDEEWSALLKAVRMGQEPDGNDQREFTDPEFEGTNADRGIGIVVRRRADAPDDAGTDGQ